MSETNKDVAIPKAELAKIFRQAVGSPGEFDGDRKKFNAWWEHMQLYMKGYPDC